MATQERRKASICDSFAFERFHLWGPPEDPRHLWAPDSTASQGAAIWIVDGFGQEIGLGVSPRRTVCILKKATLNAWAPHCLPRQSHLTIFFHNQVTFMHIRPKKEAG